MPYIGKEPVAGNFVLLDSITTSATATYALTKDSVAYSPESARNMIVSLNGVTQAPETAFTVSGSNITFSSALTSSDVIDYILVLGDVLSVGTPSDGTVGTSQMSYPLDNFSSTGIDDNATSTAITIDSSENVGIGTTTPVSLGAGYKNLDIRHTTGGGVTLGDTSNIHAYLFSDNNGVTLQSPGSRSIKFTTVSTERMRIDSSGMLGLGSTPPTDAHSTWSQFFIGEKGSVISEKLGSGGLYGLWLTDNGYVDIDTGSFSYRTTDEASSINLEAGNTIFRYAASGTAGAALTWSESMRIDSSGNLLVGTTTHRPATNNVNGVSIDATYGMEASVTSGAPLTLNRKSTDGGILSFKKDSTTVGILGASGGDLTIYSTAAGHCGLRFLGDPAIAPVNNSGTLVDDSIDIGEPSNRFKDLYLSGGAHIGGTGSGNYLDDYEEGNWTPTASSGFTSLTVDTSNCRYTKIGNTVHVRGEISGISGQNAATFVVGGLPFNIATGVESSFSIMYTQLNIDTNYSQLVGYAQAASNKFRIYECGDSQTWSAVIGTQTSSSTSLIFALTYETS